MRFAPRWRILSALVLAGFIGYFALTWAVQLAYNIVRSYRGLGYVDCPGGWRDLGYSCSATQFSTTRGWILLGVVLAVTLAIGYGLTIWALRPMRSLTRSVQRLGPQNLGERNNFDSTGDEIGRLAKAIDALMDRVAEGYEGQRRFAANASHELRTPLAVQRTLIEVSMAGDPTPDQLELLARQLLSTNERNEQLIEGLLVLAESDRGLAGSSPQRLDELAADVISYQQQLAKLAEVRIEADLAPATVPGERPLLERLFANLIQNAVKHNVTGGWIRVVVDPGGTVSVSNSGRGVDAASVPGLFEPFRRLSGDRMNHSNGSGLGLTIARSICQAHGGTIHAQANDAGGLDVKVVLPG